MFGMLFFRTRCTSDAENKPCDVAFTPHTCALGRMLSEMWTTLPLEEPPSSRNCFSCKIPWQHWVRLVKKTAVNQHHTYRMLLKANCLLVYRWFGYQSIQPPKMLGPKCFNFFTGIQVLQSWRSDRTRVWNVQQVRVLHCYVIDSWHFRCCRISISSQCTTNWNPVWMAPVKSIQ